MSNLHAGRAIFAGVALIGCSACGDNPVTPAELGAAQSPKQVPIERMADRELLLAVLTKLDALEVRLERERAEMYMRLDSLVTAGVILLAATPADGIASAPPKPSMNEQIDSIFDWVDGIYDLTSFLAEDASAVWKGTEICGKFDVKLIEAALKSNTDAHARGEGGVGVKPWDTGAAAMLALGQRFSIEFDAGAELGLGSETCLDLSNVGVDPPVRASAAALMALSPPPRSLESTIMSLQSQFGLTEQNLERVLITGNSIRQSGDPRRLVEMAALVPVPSQLRDPLGHIRSQMSGFDPVSLLCGGANFGTRLATYVSQGCGYIQNNDLPQLEPFLRVGSNLADLRNRFSNLGDDFSALSDDFDVLTGDFDGLETRFAGVCSRMNTVVDRRLRVDVDMPWGNDRILDVRLFPTDWRVTC